MASGVGESSEGPILEGDFERVDVTVLFRGFVRVSDEFLEGG